VPSRCTRRRKASANGRSARSRAACHTRVLAHARAAARTFARVPVPEREAQVQLAVLFDGQADLGCIPVQICIENYRPHLEQLVPLWFRVVVEHHACEAVVGFQLRRHGLKTLKPSGIAHATDLYIRDTHISPEIAVFVQQTCLDFDVLIFSKLLEFAAQDGDVEVIADVICNCCKCFERNLCPAFHLWK